MEQFSLEKWLQDKSRKVVTRDGRPVEILKTNRKDSIHPIIFTILDQNGVEQVHFCNKVGICTTLQSPNKFDLFFADDEEELTEFEKAISEFIQKLTFNGNVLPSKDIKGYAKSLLDLARKELQPEIDKELDKAYKTRDDVVYRNGYAQGKQDTLKAALESLPKWKKACKHTDFNEHVIILVDDDNDSRPFLDDVVREGEFYLELKDVKKLPKEE